MKCQFCKLICPTNQDVQLHQVSSCPAIEQDADAGVNEVVASFRWHGVNPDLSVDSVHLISDDLISNTELTFDQTNKFYVSSNVTVHRGTYSDAHLLIKNDILVPLQTFHVQMLPGLITEIIELFPQNELIVVSQDTITVDTTADASTDPPNDTSAVARINNDLPAVEGNEIPVPKEQIVTKPLTTANYKLNEQKAMNNKLLACDRVPFTLKQNNNSITITLNTATYEYFFQVLIEYLNNPNNNYRIENSPEGDITGQVITQDRLRVFTNSSHMFTANMYRTKSRVMVNGPHYLKFMNEDLPHIEKQISDAGSTLETANSLLKNAIQKNVATRKNTIPEQECTSTREDRPVRSRKKKSFDDFILDEEKDTRTTDKPVNASKKKAKSLATINECKYVTRSRRNPTEINPSTEDISERGGTKRRSQTQGKPTPDEMGKFEQLINNNQNQVPVSNNTGGRDESTGTVQGLAEPKNCSHETEQ